MKMIKNGTVLSIEMTIFEAEMIKDALISVNQNNTEDPEFNDLTRSFNNEFTNKVFSENPII